MKERTGFDGEMKQLGEQEDETEPRRMWRTAADAGAVGLEMGISVAIGYFGGAWLDGKFGTSPYLGLAGLFVGIGAAGSALWSTARRLNKANEDQDRSS